MKPQAVNRDEATNIGGDLTKNLAIESAMARYHVTDNSRHIRLGFLPGGDTATASRNALFSIFIVSFKMKHLAAYLLLALAGNAEPSAADIKGVLSSVGIDADSERLDKVVAELQGKDIQELISEGTTKLASVPSGGAGAAAAPAAGGDAAAPAAEEKKEEEKEESDEDMGFGLFD
ncbi:hypothetical protein VI817_000727 [Penicillium citrinum]|nr:hypothetical protein VI817_000727 [Penicillium citrinum]